MKTAIATLTIACACILSAPAEAHSPQWRHPSFEAYSAQANAYGCQVYLGCPAMVSGTVTKGILQYITYAHLNDFEQANNMGLFFQEWRSSDAGIVSMFSTYPSNRWHVCVVDRDGSWFYRWNVTCKQGWSW